MKRTTLPRLCASTAPSRGLIPPVDFQTNGHAAYAATTAGPAAVPAPREQAAAEFTQAALPAGVKVMHQCEDDRLVVVYDPAQIDALDARLLSNIYVDYTEGEQLDRLREMGREATGTRTRDLFAAVLDAVDNGDDASIVIAQVVDLFSKVRAEAGE
ncbi:hypothetical protein [Streptomyces sp. NPDC056049]|uniref:hypothetical protein n=1 Tax=Streptomyces sp. NPDC056049 TaxID=3345693 RepID=UPI0035E39144